MQANSQIASNTQSPKPAAPFELGERIEGRWEVCGVLEGGMGLVYIVYDHEHRMPYAAKTFRDDRHADNTETSAGFVEEALAWVNLDAHANITRAEFVQLISEKPFLFLEYIGGGDLSDWIGTPRLTEDLPQVLRFALQFCDGMIHAAAKGIAVHRDIKPSNCLIAEDGTLKISDFGLAKIFRRPAEERQDVPDSEAAASGAGTCTHMAPEQFEDVDRVDVRADVYSFGVLLFQMITGKLPFDGDTWEELKEQHQNQEPHSLPDAVPPFLRSLVSTCLKKNPAERFTDFGALRRALAPIYEQFAGAEPSEPAIGAKLDAVEWSNKGVSLSNLGQYAEALACYERALELNPRMKEVWNNKGITLRGLQSNMEALAAFEHALALDPRFALAWNNKGRTLESLGRRSEALACYLHARALDPKVVPGLLTRWASRTLLFCQR